MNLDTNFQMLEKHAPRRFVWGGSIPTSCGFGGAVSPQVWSRGFAPGS